MAVPLPTDLSSEAIHAHLKTRVVGRDLRLLEEVDSTNAVAITLARQAARDGTAVVAERQTSGRGRLGRGWFSPRAGNLYCSVIHRPHAGAEDFSARLTWIPLAAGLATARAIAAVTPLRPTLKWPNDVLLGDRKVAGILCEATGAPPGECSVVVGIGINVNIGAEDFPDEFRAQATSLAAEAGRSIDRSTLLAELLLQLEIAWDRLSEGARQPLLQDYTDLCSTLGRVVDVILLDGAGQRGRAARIGMDGSLHLSPEGPGHEGHREEPFIVRAGDVIHVR